MKRADAPQPGWYPDPTGGQRLWWWDGTDWTDHRRAAPRAGRLAMAEEAAEAARRAATAGAGDRDRNWGVAPRVRASASRGRGSANLSREDASTLVEEVRRATRSELERATKDLGNRATDVRKQLEPLITQYGTKLVRWARRIGVIVVVLYVLYLVISGGIQAGLTGWLGDRIDDAINSAPTSAPVWPAPSPPLIPPAVLPV